MPQRYWGAVLLASSAGLNILALFVDWYLLPYVVNDTPGNVTTSSYPVKLIEVLTNSIRPPAGVGQPQFGPGLYWEIGVLLVGIVVLVVFSILAFSTPTSLRWLFGASVVFVAVSALVWAANSVFLGLTALSPPYIAFKATPYQWLLALSAIGVLCGCYLIADAEK